MRVELEHSNGEHYTINVRYVSDKYGAERYLVLIDNENKKKYTVDTFSDRFTDDDVYSLLCDFMEKVLKWKLWSDLSNGMRESLWTEKIAGKVTKCCHNDDFYSYYHKDYMLVPFTETGLSY